MPRRSNMRSYSLVGVLLLAGGISSLPQSQDIALGGTFTLQTLTYFETVTRCHVVSPTNATIDLIPENVSEDRFELNDPRAPFGCSVRVHNATAADTGTWSIYSETENGKQNGSTFVSVLQSAIDGSVELDEENVIYLTDIDYLTTFGNSISISLSKIEKDEECFLLSNLGKRTDLSEEVTGIRAYGASAFVSCRVEVGPFDGTMIGTWTLCGKTTAGEQEELRCQRANINWHQNSPNSPPTTNTEPVREYAVSYGMTLTPGVQDGGSIHSCHVVTPAGEDIALTFDSTYPKLARASPATTCTVSFGPIDESMIGNWSLYAVFTSTLSRNSEKRQPIQFYLYDESNPYAQAYNVTTLDLQRSVVNLGTTKSFQVTGSGQIDDCSITSPAGQKYDLTSANGVEGISFQNDAAATCHVKIGPIGEGMLGEWELTGKFSNNGMFVETKQPFQIIQEDPRNPIEDGVERDIVTVGDELVNMDIAATHSFTIPREQSFVTHESCHLLTPEGLQYTLMEGFNVSGVEVLEGDNVACGVNVTVVGDFSVGEWTLISRETVYTRPTEKRLNFTIAVEVSVESSAREVTIAEGNDFHVRLQNPTELSTTCVLLRPDGSPAVEYERKDDSQYCEYIVRNMKVEHTGSWAIVYGEKILYKARTEVTVVGRSDIEVVSLNWTQDQPLDVDLGPEDAVYCRLVGPTGAVVFEGFGRCRAQIARVAEEHAGVWRMSVGSPGRLLTDDMEFTVQVVHAAPKAAVSVQVVKERPKVELTCSLATTEEVTSCKFRDPSGRVLLASHGVGEDRYSFHSAGATVRSSAGAHECRLSISDPVVADLGLWRCAIETPKDIYYGFLTVVCPWAMQDPVVAAAVVTEPKLAADTDVRAVAGDAVTMSCSVSSAIRYCYFRARNGTVFNVSPGSKGAVQYAGAGFDSGECAAQFSSLQATDGGVWSCHIGFPDSEDEQRANFLVHVEDVMTVTQTFEGTTLVIEGHVHGDRPLEYCRFVRIDGVGFASDHVIDPYTSTSSLASGRCGLRVRNPSTLDQHPWTVVAKVAGLDVEYSRVTDSTFRLPGEGVGVRRPRFAIFSFLLLSIVLSIVFTGMILGPKKNRRWAYSGVTSLRDSIRRSVRKTPPPPYTVSA